MGRREFSGSLVIKTLCSHYCCCCSATKSCLTLCDPMNCIAPVWSLVGELRSHKLYSTAKEKRRKEKLEVGILLSIWQCKNGIKFSDPQSIKIRQPWGSHPNWGPFWLCGLSKLHNLSASFSSSGKWESPYFCLHFWKLFSLAVEFQVLFFPHWEEIIPCSGASTVSD